MMKSNEGYSYLLNGLRSIATDRITITDNHQSIIIFLSRDILSLVSRLLTNEYHTKHLHPTYLRLEKL